MSPRASSLTPPLLALLQGGFYLITGLWPIIDLGSFEAVTGPKTDGWLVHTAGGLIAAIGLALLVAGARRNVSPEIRLLAICSALVLTLIELVYVVGGRIGAVYLLDALVEIAPIAGWVAVRRASPHPSPRWTPRSSPEL
jgi:hypothetical protein